MFTLKKALIAVTGLCICVPAYSITDATVPNFSVWTTVYGADVIRVVTPSAKVNPAGCADPDSYMVLSTLSKESKGRIYATLLTAKALGKPVRFFISETASEWTRPAIDTVTLE